MGNALRFLYEECCNPQPEGSIGPHGVPHATVGLSALSRDLFQFETTGQVPEGLNQHVQSSKKTQANWYTKILAAWKEARPPPSNAEEAARLIVETLKRHHKVDVEGLLTFYGLPNPTAPVQVQVPVPIAGEPTHKWSEGLKYELHTLQVDAKDVADGDTINVYVDTKNAREAANVPISVKEAMIQRREAALSVLKVQALFQCCDSAKSKIERLTVRMLNGVRTFSKINPALVSVAIYALCTGAGFMLWISMGFLDLAAGTTVLESAIHAMECVNEHVLPGLQLLNGLLAVLVGFSILLGRINITINVNSNRSTPNPNKKSTLSSRSRMIKALPQGKFGCLKRPDSGSSASPCAICLGCIGEEEEVRILPSCRHYFHIFCIDRWLLPCTGNNSSCPLCRATVISSGLHSPLID